jgi:hypothetical protein
MDDYILFDLGKDSLLEPIANETGDFRNTMYDPDILKKTHCLGKHQYLVAREIFEADLIVNLPKLKTHRKAGITAALKNLVGINGDKDYLPHHRIGGSKNGGDCYEGASLIKRLAEMLLDKQNSRINKRGHFFWKCFAAASMKLAGCIAAEKGCNLEGSWYGNDTVWRMVVDLNRLLLYGRQDGSLSQTPVRQVLSLTDGIVGGQKEGPLAPEPINSGVVTFARSSLFADMANAALMRFDWQKIPLLKNGFNSCKYPLTECKPSDIDIFCDGQRLSLIDLAEQAGSNFEATEGWRGHIEQKIYVEEDLCAEVAGEMLPSLNQEDA